MGLTTPSFSFIVEKSIGEGGFLSSNYISAIENKIIEWQNTFNANEVARNVEFEAIKTEYNTYKNVMIAESNVAELQSQINVHTSDLAEKATLVDLQQISLAYKESYATLTALQTAYPTGDTYNHSVLADGLVYTYKNSAWISTGILAIGSGIPNGTVTLVKLGSDVNTELNDKAKTYRKNKNLFNKSKVTDGYYVNSTTGIPVANTGYYISDYIEIEASTNYAKNIYDQFAFYDANKVYISGLSNNIEYFTTPANAKYVRLSINKSLVSAYYESIDKGQLEKGSSKTAYETGLSLFKREQLLDFPSWLNDGNLIFVSKSGGDFTTIQGAVDAIRDSSATKRYIIVIMQGTYEEAVSIQTKYIDLVGISLGAVTLINKTGNYDTPPLEMSCLNNVKNLIIIANEDNKPVDYSGEPAYCIHHDYVGEGENYIENCKLISYSNAPIGIGTHQNQKINIKNSELKILANPSRPALLFHPKVTTATGQKLTLDNCRMWGQGYSVLSIIDSNNNGFPGSTGDNRDTEVACYNNMFWSELNGKIDIIYNPTGALTVGAIDGYIKLAPESYGNNAPELNS